MPTINFAFGIGNYFNFTFNLQLGSASPTQAEPARHRKLKCTLEDRSTTANPISVTDQYNDQWATSEDQLIDLSGSTSIPQPCPHLTPVQDADSPADAPAPGGYGMSTASRPVVISIRPLPRTPKSRPRTVPPLIPRYKPKTKFFSLGSTSQQSKLVPTGARAPSPRPSKPFSKPLPTPPESDTPGTPCKVPPFFERLPLEVRCMVYHELLVSKQSVKKPHRLVCNKRSIMLDSIQPVKDIDSSILRVCRSIYDEALPVLYGQNTFEFAKPRKLRDFSHGYLEKRGPKFAFREAQAGRFTLIRSVVLRLGYDRKPYAFQRPVGVAPAVPDRKRIWSHWYQYFFNDNDSRNQYDWGWFPTTGNEFPALDKVELDFTDWQLSEGDAIRVEPFISKLSKSGGLSSVTTRGMKNSINLQQLRQGLMKPGGTFTAIN